MREFLTGLLFLIGVMFLVGMGILLIPFLLVLDFFLRILIGFALILLAIWLVGKWVLFLWDRTGKHNRLS
jgi:hypothetical protein